MMASPDLSICIVSWNTRDDLEQALTSVCGSDAGLRLQVIVVDNASEDGSAAMVRERFPSARLLESRANTEFPLCCV